MSLTLTPAAQSPRQRLSHRRLKAEESPSALDITRTLSTQELLPQHLLSSIQAEKAQSQRFEEQLQRWLVVDPLDAVSMPLFMPSTLLSVPEILAPTCRFTVSAGSFKQDIEMEAPAEKVPSTLRRHAPLSLAQRLEELDRLILMNREEDMACSLKLNSLLEIIED